MKRILFILALAFFTANTFAQSTSNSININTNEVLKIYLDGRGKIFVDGKKLNIKKLEQKLINLKAKNGIVYYSRAKVNKKFVLDKSTEIAKLVSKYKRIIRFFDDKNFTKEIVW